MKLSLVGPAFPLKGGIAQNVHWLQRELGRRGHEIQTISYRTLYPRLLLRFFRRPPSLDTSRSTPEMVSLPLLHPTNPITWLRAAREIRSFAPRLVLVQWWNPFFAPMLGCLTRLVRRSGTDIVFECHNVLPHERSALDGMALRFAFAPASAFLLHSRMVLEELRSIDPETPALIAPLPAIGDFATDPTADRSGRVILFFGLVRKYKGLDVLLKALPKVLSRFSCELIVAGEFYVPVEKYRSMARDLGVEKHARFENRYIPDEEVPDFFDRADVLVMPYLTATQSGVVRSAFASRLPVIASRTGGLAEAVQEGFNGLLFPPGDADALADRLLEYFENGLGPIFSRNLESVRSPDLQVCDAIESLGRGDYGRAKPPSSGTSTSDA